MSKLYMGIDPGKSGVIAVFNPAEITFQFFEIPKIGDKVIDVVELSNIFFKSTLSSSDTIVHCCIEQVHAIFGASAGSTFEFGYVAGLLEMAIVSNGIPFSKVQPKQWQKRMWEGVPIQKKDSSTGKTKVNDTKSMSLVAAKRLFPNVSLLRTPRCSKPDENRVDALLIAAYCYHTFKK